MPDRDQHDGNAAQTRTVAEAVARQMMDLYGAPATPKPEVPAALKLAGGIVAAIMTMGSLALAVWLISTVNSMQVTLARMDERQVMNAQGLNDRFQAIDKRFDALEEARVPK
jgi:hypothetical protein